MDKIDVYIINLAHRKDRWTDITKNIAQNSKIINPIRFNAVKPAKTVYRISHRRKKNATGELGLALSQLKLIQMAKDKKLPYVIIFEDDTRIISGFDGHFKLLLEYLQNNKDWDIFNGNPTSIVPKNIHKAKIINPYPTIISVMGLTANFVIFSERYYDRLLEHKNIYETNRFPAFDGYMNDYTDKRITYWPLLTTQAPGRSDIENRSVNYCGIIKAVEKTLGTFVNNNTIVCKKEDFDSKNEEYQKKFREALDKGCRLKIG